jgi:hypothetical protein
VSAGIRYCPVCGHGPWDEGYAGAAELRASFHICECCGCEYGYDDNVAHFERWVASGMKWFAPERKPRGWNSDEQLKRIIRPWPPGSRG